mmetsp:Transcript_25488/g.42539  ORF Transcript_25488/g.42539 Transcript_25488/m.42539 type:complete len:449 (+) Transcript_25488:85-1431(+)
MSGYYNSIWRSKDSKKKKTQVQDYYKSTSLSSLSVHQKTQHQRPYNERSHTRQLDTRPQIHHSDRSSIGSNRSRSASTCADASSFSIYSQLLTSLGIFGNKVHLEASKPLVPNTPITSSHPQRILDDQERLVNDMGVMNSWNEEMKVDLQNRTAVKMNDEPKIVPISMKDSLSIIFPPSKPDEEEMDVEEEVVIAGGPSADNLIASRFAPVNEEELAALRQTLRKSPTCSDIVIDKYNIDMTASKMNCLNSGQWLNDEVVNFYMEMLKERDGELCAAQPGRRDSHYFSSFFLDRLMDQKLTRKYTYSQVKRWTKKFDVFEKEKIFMPVNLNNTHWTMAVVFVQRKEIHYYDSMSGCGNRWLEAVLHWLQDEADTKKGQVLEAAEWTLLDGGPSAAAVPQQQNGSDCGVFSIMCADFLSDDLPLAYSQQHMRDIRLKIGTDIMRGKLNY